MNLKQEPNLFSLNYQDARARFLREARQAGFAVHSFRHPHSGLDGLPLFVDVAQAGSVDATSALITSSGIHGIEGFAGSAIQSNAMKKGAAEPSSDLAVVHIHALNPYGFETGRRVDGDNVDLNRNFIDWGNGPPEDHPLTAKLRTVLMPEGEWKWPFWRVAGFILRHGFHNAQTVLTQGQYGFADGLFHGGKKAVWSNMIWRHIIHTEMNRFKNIGHIDFHTGLGPRGHGELILAEAPASQTYSRARDWWGKVTSTQDGSSTSAQLRGDMQNAFVSASKALVTSATLEFGTVSKLNVLKALAADNWLHSRGISDPEYIHAIRKQMQAAFNPQDRVWQEKVIARGLEVVHQAGKGLTL